MTKKTLGYVHLEWTCPNCGARNPGPQKTCTGCGAAQPENVAFEQPAQEKLITEEKEIERAKAGPDVHCAFCGARNPAGTEICTQCGADLREGKARVSGQVVGAHRDRPVPEVACPSCGALNPAAAQKCSQCGASMAQPRPEPAQRPALVRRGGCSPAVYVVAAIAVLLGIVFLLLLTRTSDTIATVQSVEWKRAIAIEELAPVTYEDWRDEIPPAAVLGTCNQKVHHTQEQPAPNSREVCGTPYTVDKGSGYGEVTQDCQYEVYADWCKYQVEEWQAVREEALNGNDLIPRWPSPNLGEAQREGRRVERYQVVFDADGKTYTFATTDPDQFARFLIGSRWMLEVNQLNSVVSVEPAP